MIGFRDGVSKSKNAILDSINGEKAFQPNPNFAVARPRRPLISMKKTTPLEVEDDDGVTLAEFLPEPVPPLTMTQEEKSSFLGELALDYDYLVELREEIIAGSDDGYGEKEDKKILAIVNDAMIYLNQRAQFWSQQGPPEPSPEKHEMSPDRTASRPGTTPRKTTTVRVTKVQSGAGSARRVRENSAEQAHYEMSKIQVYEAKYGVKSQ
jgi:hypothetical protein